MLFPSLLCTLALANVPTANTTVGVDVSGQYLEIRTCDVYTGPCFANAECGIVGREAALAWKVDRGAIGGVDVAGLAVVAVLSSDATFGNPYETATDVKSVLLLDAKADAAQRDALRSFATAQLEPMRARVTNEHVVAIELATGCCDNAGCATLEAGTIVNAKTRCVHKEDKHCGNESIFYPPLQDVSGVTPAVAETFTVEVPELDARFTEVQRRGAFTARFTENGMVPVAIANLPPAQRTDADQAEFGMQALDVAREGAAKDDAVPADVPEAFKALVVENGLRVTTRKGEEIKPLYDLWTVKELPIVDAEDKSAIQFGQIPVTSFVGILKSYDRGSDYRDNAIPAGTWILRYGLQPSDGNHLGTAPSRDFVVLTNFEHDPDPAPLASMKALEELAMAASPSDHPTVLYLLRPEVEAKDGPQFYKHTERDEWIADVVIKGRAKDAKDTTDVRLGIVLVGMSEHP